MPAAQVVPVAKALYLCDGTIGVSGGKTDLMGLFNTVTAAGFPHLAKDFVVFAQLSQGLGQVPFYVDIRFAPGNQLVYTSNVHTIGFPHRDMTVQVAYTVPRCPFRSRACISLSFFATISGWPTLRCCSDEQEESAMNPEQARQENPPGQEERSFIGELQTFTDPPGGAALDDPEVRARKRCGRPADDARTASPDSNSA